MKAAKPVLALAALALAAGAVLLVASRFGGPEIELTGAVAAPIAGSGDTIAVFLSIENRGGPDRVVAARSITARRAILDGAVADAGLPVPADTTAALAPESAFIRLEGVGGALTEGRLIPITLRFEHGGEINTRAELVAPVVAGDAATFGLPGLGDVHRVAPGEPFPQLALQVRPDGDDWTVELQTADFTFGPDDGDGAHVPGTGHAVLTLGGLLLERLFEPSGRIGALPPGTHELRVTLTTNDGRPYVVGAAPVTATARIEAR